MYYLNSATKSITVIIFILSGLSGIFCQSPYYSWSSPFLQTIGSSSENFSANDASGNVYSIGTFSGTVDFDPGPGVLNITATAAKDLFLLKLDSMGNLIWLRTFNGGGTSQCVARSIFVSPTGTIYFTGNISGTVDFDPGPGNLMLSGFGFVISKFDSNGNLIWAKQIDGPGSNRPNCITADIQGNVYTTGYFGGTLSTDFDPGPGTINRNSTGAGDFDGFLLKLDSIGTYKWVKTFTGVGTCDSRSVAVDPLGVYVYVTGTFQQVHDFNPTGGSFTLGSIGNFDSFTARYQCSTGAFGWAKRLGGSQRDQGTDITIDASGNPIITGHFQGTTGGMFSVNAGIGFYGVYVAKLNPTGSNVWIKSLTSDNSIESPQICRDISNNIYLSCFLYGTADMDPNSGIFTLNNPTSLPSSTISKWDNNANFIWSGIIISTDSEVHSLSCNNSGSVYASGFVGGTTDFDPGPLQSLLNSPGSSPCAYVVKWGDCESPNIVSQPSSTSICDGNNATFSVNSTGTGLIYQWQVDTGSGFTNLSNIPPYSNVTSSTINITNANDSLNGNLFRCIVGGTCGAPVNSNNVTLQVNSSYNVSTTHSICNGNSYNFGPQNLTLQGVYTQTFSTVHGCDSTVHLNLNVNPTYSVPFTTSICNGDTYILGTQTLTSPGTYSETFSSINGCDSIVNLTLIVYPTYNTPVTESICNGDTYILGTQTINSAGTYSETFYTINGCDSIVNLTLNINPTYTVPVTTSICNGDSYILGTQTLTSPGTYSETFSSINGCDSIVNLTLIVHSTYNTPVTESICNGDTYILGTQTINSAGTYSETFTTTNGCDSIVNLTLNINPTYNVPITASICYGDTYTLGSQTITSPGNYNETFYTTHGCDSIVNLTLTVHPTYSIPISASICNGDTYTLGTQTLTSSGNYNETLYTVNGCDSIINLTLNVHPTHNIPITASICNGDTYTLGTQTLTSTGNYNETFYTINGCDSIVALTLNVNPTYYISISASICNGDSYMLGTQILNSSGIYNENFSTIQGCDSVVSLNLDVVTVNTTVSQLGNIISANLGGASYQWIDCNTNSIIPGETNQSFTVTSNGNYAVIITDSSCLDTSSCLSIQDLSIETSMNIPINVFPNPATQNLHVKFSSTPVSNIYYQIYNLYGEMIQAGTSDNNPFTINLLGIKTGTYILKLYQNGLQLNVTKFLVQNLW